MKPSRDLKRGGNTSKSGKVEKRALEASPLATQSNRKKRLRRDTSTASLGAAAAAAAPPLKEQQTQPEPDVGLAADISFLPTPSDIDQQVHAAIQAMKTASPIGGATHLETVRTLRQLLSNYENPPSLAVLSSGGIPALISALQPPQSNATSVETIFEAAWALTNLAVGEPEVVKAVVPAAPVLIAHLGGGSGLAVAEQCAWALGNIAGDDVEYKETIIANGAVPPLTQLLIQGVTSGIAVATGAWKIAGHHIQTADKEPDFSVPEIDQSLNLVESQQAIEAGATASWALGNLLRGAGEAEIGAFMSTEGAPTALIKSIEIFYSGDRFQPPVVGPQQSMEHPPLGAPSSSSITATTTTPLPNSIENLCIETAWVLAYVTSGPEKYIVRLIEGPVSLVPILSCKLVSAVERVMMGQSQREKLSSGLHDDDEYYDDDQDAIITPSRLTESGLRGLKMLTPLLRTLGNVVAAVGAEDSKNAFSSCRTQLIPEFPMTVDAEYSGPLAIINIENVVVCAESADHGLQREAAWVLANYAGTPGRDGVEAVKKAHAVPALLYLLKEQPFHVRKEAAFALANICAGGGGGTGDAEALNYLFGADVDALRAMLSLVRSADIEAAKLGLQFIEMLLRMLPNAVKEVEAADGIDAIESLQFGATAPPELQAAAAQLVNTYWGVE